MILTSEALLIRLQTSSIFMRTYLFEKKELLTFTCTFMPATARKNAWITTQYCQPRVCFELIVNQRKVLVQMSNTNTIFMHCSFDHAMKEPNAYVLSPTPSK